MGEQQTSRQLLSIVYNAATVVRAAAAAVAVAATLFTSRQTIACSSCRSREAGAEEAARLSSHQWQTYEYQNTTYRIHQSQTFEAEACTTIKNASLSRPCHKWLVSVTGQHVHRTTAQQQRTHTHTATAAAADT
jgi:hypothetical protein